MADLCWDFSSICNGFAGQLEAGWSRRASLLTVGSCATYPSPASRLAQDLAHGGSDLRTRGDKPHVQAAFKSLLTSYLLLPIGQSKSQSHGQVQNQHERGQPQGTDTRKHEQSGGHHLNKLLHLVSCCYVSSLYIHCWSTVSKEWPPGQAGESKVVSHFSHAFCRNQFFSFLPSPSLKGLALNKVISIDYLMERILSGELEYIFPAESFSLDHLSLWD